MLEPVKLGGSLKAWGALTAIVAALALSGCATAAEEASSSATQTEEQTTPTETESAPAPSPAPDSSPAPEEEEEPERESPPPDEEEGEACGGEVEGPGSTCHAEDEKFCGENTCIPNFPNGNGAVVRCNDGEYSHSGGLSGACSDHEGEAE
jgi:hypothetical protein